MLYEENNIERLCVCVCATHIALSCVLCCCCCRRKKKTKSLSCFLQSLNAVLYQYISRLMEHHSYVCMKYIFYRSIQASTINITFTSSFSYFFFCCLLLLFVLKCCSTLLPCRRRLRLCRHCWCVFSLSLSSLYSEFFFCFYSGFLVLVFASAWCWSKSTSSLWYTCFFRL